MKFKFWSKNHVQSISKFKFAIDMLLAIVKLSFDYE